MKSNWSAANRNEPSNSSSSSPANHLAGDKLWKGQQRDFSRKYQPTAKANTAKMPMTCHNRRPQNTTVSEVMGSGFFGGSVGKSCEVKGRQRWIEWILPLTKYTLPCCQKACKARHYFMPYILQWCLVNVSLATINVNMTSKRKSNEMEHFITQNFI